MKQFIFDYMDTWQEEIDPKAFYRLLFPEELMQVGADDLRKGRYHGAYLLKNPPKGVARNRFFYADLQGLYDVIDNKVDAAVPAVLYRYPSKERRNGGRRNSEAAYITALSVDLDGIGSEKQLRTLSYQTEKVSWIPQPTHYVCSGNGLHLYYLLDAPVFCNHKILDALRIFKTELTRILWSKDITRWSDHPQFEAVTQPMRVAGSVTKDGHITKVYETGRRPWSLQELEDFANDNWLHMKSSIDLTIERSARLSIAQAKEMYPEWYEKRIVQKEKAGRWVCNRGLYEWWLRRLRDNQEARVGQRYYCVYMLTAYAVKCNVPFEQVRKDAYELIPILDSISPSENRFTQEDVDAALQAYENELTSVKLSRKFIETKTGLRIEGARRNGRTQEEHLKVARAACTALHGEDWHGRKPKADIVKAWREAHPDGKKADCIRETGLSKPTVLKWWEGEPAAMVKPQKAQERQQETLEDILKQIAAMPEEQRAELLEKLKEPSQEFEQAILDISHSGGAL